MTDTFVVIPSWAKLSAEMQAESGVTHAAFIQLGGMPLYAHIINSYSLSHPSSKYIIVLDEDAPPIHADTVADHKVSVVRLGSSDNIATTVLAALRDLPCDSHLVVHMGDTLIRAAGLADGTDRLYAQPRTDLYRWTTLTQDDSGQIKILADREEQAPDSEQLACVGVFQFSSLEHFRTCLTLASEQNKPGMDPFFRALAAYSAIKPISVAQADHWLDCGHIDSYYESKMQYQNLRHFNSLTYDTEHGTVTKRSRNVAPFRHQVRWFRQIPDSIASFLPRIYESSDGDDPFITMELLSIPTLTDLFVNERLPIGAWNDVAAKLSHISRLLTEQRVDTPLGEPIAREIYVHKTLTRLETLLREQVEFQKYKVVVNDASYGLQDVIDHLESFVAKERILQMTSISPIHGDLCFSNILFDPRARIIKLIDPRGEFAVPGIYGDPRYDMAKLMHSFEGGYDFMVTDQFSTQVDENGIVQCSVTRTSYHDKVATILIKKLIPEADMQRQTRAIESLLFLSMLPLHSDKPKRQLAMFHRGMSIFVQLLLTQQPS